MRGIVRGLKGEDMRHRRWLIRLGILSAVPWLVAGGLWFRAGQVSSDTRAILPTRAVLASSTPTEHPTQTSLPTLTFTPSSTPTITATPLPTTTPFPSATPTLAVRVWEMQAIMPDVQLQPTTTPFPEGTILLPAPPNPMEPLPDATHQSSPFEGWFSFESDHPLVRYAPQHWEPRLHEEASRGQYHRRESAGGSVIFPFEGEGLRIRYVAGINMGVFEVVVDGQVIDIVDAYASELRFVGTRVYFVGSGEHRLLIRPIGERNRLSEDTVVGLDAIQVFRGDPNTLILPPDQLRPTATQTAHPAADIQLMAAPATLQPTSTTVPPGELRLSVVVAYDENGNREVDPAEGVAGLSVRAVEVETNQAVAQAFTDRTGYAQLAVIAATDLQVVVPYFGQVWSVSSSRSGSASFALLIEPGNQPGLIP